MKKKIASDLQHTPSSSRAWFKTASKFLKYDSGQQTIPTLETEKGLIESEQEKTEVLNDHFINPSTINDTTATLPPFILPAHETLSSITITQVDVIKAIKLLDFLKKACIN